MRPREFGNLRGLPAGDEDTDFLISEFLLIDLDVIEEVIGLEQIATVSDTGKGVAGEPTAGVAISISEAKVPIGRLAFRNGKDGDLVRHNRNSECGRRRLLNLEVLENIYTGLQCVVSWHQGRNTYVNDLESRPCALAELRPSPPGRLN